MDADVPVVIFVGIPEVVHEGFVGYGRDGLLSLDDLIEDAADRSLDLKIVKQGRLVQVSFLEMSVKNRR